MTLEAELAGIVGTANLLTDTDARAAYEVDWTGAWRGRARAVVRPHTTPEVSAVMAACTAAGVPVVPQGGNTGLVGGSVPGPDGTSVVLTTSGLAGEPQLDPLTGHVVAGAGTTLAALQASVAGAGLEFGVDLAARGTATIGGLTATNAGGIRVLHHGTTRRQLLGVEAVLADGTVLSHLRGLEKDNTGYDLAGLLCGSEGTLAVITRVCARLVPIQPHRVAALLALGDLDGVVAAVGHLRTAVPGLDAAEYFVAAGAALVKAEFGVADPFSRAYPAYLLVEAGGREDPTAGLGAAVGGCDGVLDAAVASDASRRAVLWELREHHTDALARRGPPRKYDVTVPLDGMAGFVARSMALIGEHPGLTCHHFGHAGDGNVHLNILGTVEDPEALDGAVLRLVASVGGSISAEHGIGRFKRPWLGLARTDAEIAAFRSIKRALDPAGLLNPGVLLP